MAPVMDIQEITDRERISDLLSQTPMTLLEALDENVLGREGSVSVFAEDTPDPANMLVVRWGQQNLGLGSVASLVARRVFELQGLVTAFPRDRGPFELLVPFWASGVLQAELGAEPLGVEARYFVSRASLAEARAVGQCERITDHAIVRPMFPKLAADTPVQVLSLAGQLQAVAAVTHLRANIARLSVYTVEEARGRGFGRAVLVALADELLAHGMVPSVALNLSDEPAARMVEGAGFRQDHTFMKVSVKRRREGENPHLGILQT